MGSSVKEGGGGGGGKRALRIIDGLSAKKMPLLMKISRSYTLWLCMIGGKTCEARLAK